MKPLTEGEPYCPIHKCHADNCDHPPLGYPREDRCHRCGEHLGWVMTPVGELLALGICGDCGDQEE